MTKSRRIPSPQVIINLKSLMAIKNPSKAKAGKNGGGDGEMR
jgi:hypothetical protein